MPNQALQQMPHACHADCLRSRLAAPKSSLSLRSLGHFPAMHPHQSRIDHCNRALQAVHSVIPSDLYTEVHDYINRRDEWGLGIESLIDGLSELELRITEEQFTLIEAAMASMALAGSSRVCYLRDHNVAA